MGLSKINSFPPIRQLKELFCIEFLYICRTKVVRIMQPVKFFVIEGLDGAGKSTQVKMLEQFFENQGIKSKYLHFPRLESPVIGDMIAAFLRGEYGAIEQVHPSLVALLYAEDRRDAAQVIRQWMEEGYWVIVDRYVYSNIAYQCAKIENEKGALDLRNFIFKLEYEHFNIPKPDLSVFLDVPFAFTQKKLTEVREGQDREYLRGAQDIHEADLAFQQRVREVYLKQELLDNRFKVVSCSDHGASMASPDIIFSRIQNLVNQYLLS